ncbi:MAG: hypothetical protein R3Y64_11390 [Peptostreptococcaceae bacterium]
MKIKINNTFQEAYIKVFINPTTTNILIYTNEDDKIYAIISSVFTTELKRLNKNSLYIKNKKEYQWIYDFLKHNNLVQYIPKYNKTINNQLYLYFNLNINERRFYETI